MGSIVGRAAAGNPASGRHADSRAGKSEVLAKLDVAAEYASMGVRFSAPSANAKGWRACYAVGREESKPSAAVNVQTGAYKDHGQDGESLSFWDFAVRYGNFGDFPAVFKHFTEKAGVGWNPKPSPKRPAPSDASDGSDASKRRGFRSFEAAAASLGKLVAYWIYLGRDGEEVLRVGRFDVAKKGKRSKLYLPFSVDPELGWVVEDPPGPLPLFGLPELLADASARVWVQEGEKCSDLAKALGLLATTSSHGALSAGKTDWRPLAGRDVVIAPDNDDNGRKYADAVLKALAGLSPLPRVRVLNLPDLPEKGDLEQWLEQCPDTWDDARTRAELEKLADEAPVRDLDEAASNPEYSGLSDAELGIVHADRVAPESVEWEWENRIARGKVNLMAGEGGDGKSQTAAAIVAAISSGRNYPDGTGPATRGTCLVLAAEDGQADTIIPRLIAAGADLGKVKIITAKVATKSKEGTPLIHFKSFQDLDYWRAIIARLVDVRLIVADPIPAYLGRGVNDNRNSEVRTVLEPFSEMLNDLRVALLGITHMGKSADLKAPVHKILGSVAYSNLARTVHVTVRDPDSKDRRVLFQVKNNFGPLQGALAYRVVDSPFEHAGREIRTSKVVFDTGIVDADAAEMMADARTPKKKRGPSPERTRGLAEWLFDHLKDRPFPIPLGAIFDAAGQAKLIGEKKSDGKWSSGALLYQAKDFIPYLDSPRDGASIEDFKTSIRDGGRDVVHWRLARPEADHGATTIPIF